MESNGLVDHEDIQIEEIPDEFQCCVCLELLYKPVVLGCGHISCFWCIFKAMNTWRESHCPICRHPYNHFPSVCRLMHSLLVKLYPLASERREKQVAEEERNEERDEGSCSPQFDDYLSESLVPDAASPHSSKDVSIVTATSSSTTNKDSVSKNNNVADEDASVSKSSVLMTDLLCGICKLLLCRPVVLNCGHVYCENCVINPSDKLCRCPVCQLEHPNGYPNVCLVLEHFLEEQFPEFYLERKKASLQNPDRQVPSTQIQAGAAGCESQPKFDISTWLSGEGPSVHFRVGCDYCGMFPIVGERYKCKNCKEKVGFDLCEGCYKSSSKLPGRFNQQHTEDHQFDLMQPPRVGNLVLRLQPERREEVGFIDLVEYVEEDSSEANPARDDLRDNQPDNVPSDDTGEDHPNLY